MDRAPGYIRSKMIGLVFALLVLLSSAQTASAHDGQPPAPHDLWSAWNWDAVVILSLILGAWIYAGSQRELRRRVGSQQRSVLSWRAVSFTAGLITLFLALVWPLDALSAALFSAHMLQHMLLIAIIPPLLILGVSPGSVLLALPSPLQRKVGNWWRGTRWVKSAFGVLIRPTVAWALNSLTLWVWHAPRLYQAALANEALHMLEHLSFIGTSLLFWWTIARPAARLGRGDPGILALFTMALQGGFLGALITFAPTPWYAAYTSTTRSWGLSLLEDQQLAGAIMWIPVGLIYTVAALILFLNRLAWIDHQANQRERLRRKERKGIASLESREE